MCGIVAAVSPTSNIVPVLFEGLRKLEYRGYDSAGLAVLNGSRVECARTAGRVAELAAAAEGVAPQVGIAHTRWATHGAPSERNAHPHVSGGIAVVHNSIIENHETLRSTLSAQGYVFTSDTDTETIAHLVEAELRTEPDLFKAVQAATRRLVGAYAIAVADQRQPGKVVIAREGSPLLLGQVSADDDSAPVRGHFAASDASALLQVTRNMIYLENGDIAELTAAGIRIADGSGAPVERPVVVSQLSSDAVELGHYSHYMQKEIFEQPGETADTLAALRCRRARRRAQAEGNHLHPRLLPSPLTTACSTSSSPTSRKYRHAAASCVSLPAPTATPSRPTIFPCCDCRSITATCRRPFM